MSVAILLLFIAIIPLVFAQMVTADFFPALQRDRSVSQVVAKNSPRQVAECQNATIVRLVNEFTRSKKY